MTVTHHYNGGAALTAPASVQLDKETVGFGSRAYLGNPEQITLIVDDHAEALSFAHHKSWKIAESAATLGNREIFYGFISEIAIHEGEGTSFFPVGGRACELTIVEAQTWIVRRLLRHEDTLTERPEETVSARIAWLLTTVGFSGTVVDDGGVVPCSTLVPAKNYEDLNGQDVLQDCAAVTGWNYFIRRREADDDFELFFRDDLTNTLMDVSTFAISSDGDDDNVTIWAPLGKARLTLSGQRIASGLSVPYDGGSVYGENATTASTYASIDQVADAYDLKDQAAAEDLRDHLLRQHNTPEGVVRVVVRLPAANVNDARQGQLITAKFPRLPGWSDFTPCRVQMRNVRRPESLTQAWYDVAYELVPLVATQAVESQLQAPGDDNYVGGSLFDIVYAHDGDDPASGCSAVPITDLQAYQGSAGARTGLVMNGSGAVTIHNEGTLSGSTAGGNHTFDAYIYVNDTEVAHATYTDVDPMTGGDPDARALSWTWDHSVTVDVVRGDVVRTKFRVAPAPAILVIPAGVGSCSNELRVTGNLADR